jgi:multidrug resistance efflux pump
LKRQEHDAVDELARQARNRVEALLRDIDLARRALEEKTGFLEQARMALQAATVLSPVDGVFLGSRARQGEPVSMLLDDLLQIGVDLYELQVTVEPEPPVLDRLKVGGTALVQVLDYSKDAVDGEVASIDPKTGRVVLTFTPPGPTVRPGMIAVVKIGVR